MRGMRRRRLRRSTAAGDVVGAPAALLRERCGQYRRSVSGGRELNGRRDDAVRLPVGMDVRVRPVNTRTARAFTDAFEDLGGSVLTVGKTLELVHPSGNVGQYEDAELGFFVRAWSLAQGDE